LPLRTGAASVPGCPTHCSDWREQLVDGFQQGGFAGAVAVGDEEDFAEYHVEEHLFLAISIAKKERICIYSKTLILRVR
jgi:hypothetical protein